MKVLFCYHTKGVVGRCLADVESITMEEIQNVERKVELDLGADCIVCTGIFPLGPSRNECMEAIEAFLRAGENAFDGDVMFKVFPKAAVDGLRGFWDENRLK